MNKHTTHKQIYDISKAAWLYHNNQIKPTLFHADSTQDNIQSWIKILDDFLLNVVWNNGAINVNYYRSNDYGRWFSNGIQTIPRSVRGFLLHDKPIIDIDMVNAHPVILRYLKKEYKIDINTPYLDEYVFNREMVFKLYFNNSKEFGKKQILVATNTDNIKTSNIWLKSYFDDVCKIRDGLKKVPDLKPILKRSMSKKNKDGSFMNHVLCKWEEIIINDVIKFFQDRKYNMFSYMMDGIMMYSKKTWENDLKDLNEYIKLNYNEPTFVFTEKRIENENNIIVDDVVDNDMIENMLSLKKDYESVLSRLEAKYHICKITESFMIKQNGKFKSLNKNGIISFLDDKLCYIINNKGERELKPIHNKWINDENKLSYEEVVCEPDNSKVKPNQLNIYEPYEIENLVGKEYNHDEEGLNMFKHLINCIGNHEDNVIELLTKWIAHLVQYPGEKPGICPVITGVQGTGKDTLILTIQSILGANKVFTSQQPENQVWGRFNSQMNGIKLVYLSEINKSNSNMYYNRIKGLLTDDKITIKGECEKPFTVSSYHAYICGTNNEEPFELKEGDRRMWLMRTSSELKGNKEWFDTYYQTKINNTDFILTIYDYLNNIKDVPRKFTESDIENGKSKIHIEFVKGNNDVEKDFLMNYVGLNYVPDDEEIIKINSSDFYNMFIEYARNNIGKDFEYSQKKFTLKMKVYNCEDYKGCIEWKPTKHGKIFQIKIKELYDLFGLVIY